MKHTWTLFVSLTCLALSPAAALAADDELEVTMEVIDDLASIDGQIVRMQGPEDGGRTSDEGVAGDGFDIEDDDAQDVDADRNVDESDFLDDFGEELSDDFEHDDNGEGLADLDFESNDDLEEGEDVDDDRFDEVEDDMDEEMDDEVSSEARM